MKTYTNEAINAMNLTEVNEAIEAIENDGWYISAEMADRLCGEEAERYNEANTTLRRLYNRKGQLRQETKEYWEEVANRQIGYITKWTEEYNTTESAYKKAMLTKSIEEAKKDLAKAEKKLAEF
jgi:hypothetical protein